MIEMREVLAFSRPIFCFYSKCSRTETWEGNLGRMKPAQGRGSRVSRERYRIIPDGNETLHKNILNAMYSIMFLASTPQELLLPWAQRSLYLANSTSETVWEAFIAWSLPMEPSPSILSFPLIRRSVFSIVPDPKISYNLLYLVLAHIFLTSTSL